MVDDVGPEYFGDVVVANNIGSNQKKEFEPPAITAAAAAATIKFSSITNRQQRQQRLSLAALTKMWKSPPWKCPKPKQRQNAPYHSNSTASVLKPSCFFKKNNAIYILIYFGLIFTFLLSSSNANLASAASSTIDASTSTSSPSPSSSTTSAAAASTSKQKTDSGTTPPSSTSTITSSKGPFDDFQFHEEGLAEGAFEEEDFLSEMLDETAESESRLHRHLMESYSKDARPSKISNVSVHLQLISLDDVQESGNIILTVQIWMTWRDLRFRWSPSNYSGVVNLQILPVDRIWFPLFWIRNSAQPDIQNSFWSHFPAFIGWTGIVSWVSSGKVTVACDLDFFYYPSDSQTCAIQFAAHDSYHVNLTSRDEQQPICFDRYTNNSLWEISGVRAIPSGLTVHRTTEFLSFELRLRRRPLTDILRIFLPTACLAIVSLIAFLLPPDSGDKLNVTFTTMLAFFVMFLAITDMVPFTAEHTPIMTYFVVLTLLLSTIETILCAVIMTLADTEKAREATLSVTACEESSRKSSLLLEQIHQLQKRHSGDRRGSNLLGYTWAEHLEQQETFLHDDPPRPRSNSNTSTATSNLSTTDSGVLEICGVDAAMITALKNQQQRRKNSTSLLIGSARGIDGAPLLKSSSIRRRVGVFAIKIWRRLSALVTRRQFEEETSTSAREALILDGEGLVSSKRLNLMSFFIFGSVKIVLISLVSVILYDQSRQDDVEASGFHRPEYSNCWQ